MEISDKLILVTGATGFIGGRVVERLVKEEHARVRALVRDESKAADLRAWGCEIARGDLTDAESVRRACLSPKVWRGQKLGCGRTGSFETSDCADERRRH
jgi:NAD(P)-dependent dehydrogenase (short-subunit alcohol dehydrogenase family)